MNWLSYQRFRTSNLTPNAFVTIVGTQRQSVKEIIRSHEPKYSKVLVLDALDTLGILTNTNDCFTMYSPAFFDVLSQLPSHSAVVIDFTLLPKEVLPQFQELSEKRNDMNLTFFVMFSQPYMIPFWVAEQTDFAILYRVNGNDHVFLMFGHFFPDMSEFAYALEQYAKFYECLVIDNTRKKAWWYRPYNI
jgi:hypothetical protein